MIVHESNNDPGDFLDHCSADIFYGGRYWDRTSGPCRVKRKVGGSQINDMRAQVLVAMSFCYHVMSRDITQCHC